MDANSSQSNTENTPFSSSTTTTTSTTSTDPFAPVQPLQPLQTPAPVTPLEPFNVTQADTANPISASEQLPSNVPPPVAEEPKKNMSILNILLLVVAVILLLSLTYIVYAKFTTKPDVNPGTYTQVQPTEEPVPADTTGTEPADSASEPTMGPDAIPFPDGTPTP